MALEHAFILSAGRGTRMGEIGTLLPKLLWPVFEKTLLELQVLYARSLGCKKIYINSHFLHEQIKKFLEEKKWNDVILVHEEILLDVGGGILNIARRKEMKEAKNLLLLNGDQFFVFSKDFLQEASLKLQSAKAFLFALEVSPSEGYNETIAENDELKNIESPEGKSQNYLTYSGVGIVNLTLLKDKEGPSKFFETVANYEEGKVIIKKPPQYEYWDFGTLKRYHASIYKLLKDKIDKKDSSFLKFCETSNVFTESKIYPAINSYGEKRFKNTISFKETDLINYEGAKAICLTQEEGLAIEGEGVYYEGVYSPLI